MKLVFSIITVCICLALPARAEHHGRGVSHKLIELAHEIEEYADDLEALVRPLAGHERAAAELDRLVESVHEFHKFAEHAPSASAAQWQREFNKVDGVFRSFKRALKQAQKLSPSSQVERRYYELAGQYARLEWLVPEEGGDFLPPPPVGTTLKPIDLRDAFTYSTGTAYPAASTIEATNAKAQAACRSWIESVRKLSAGKVVVSQCSGGNQVKGDDSNINIEVQGEIQLGFDEIVGKAAPQSLSLPIVHSTGTAYPAESTLDASRQAALSYCQAWAKGVVDRSRGTLLYVQCGAPKRVKSAIDGNVAISVTGSVAVTWPVNKQARNLNQAFTVSTGTAYPAASTIAAKASEAATQCSNWVAQTIGGSAGTPVLASCAGPDVVKNSNVDVKYAGTLIFIP